MAIKALNLGKSWDFQSKSDPDRGTDQATTFKLHSLDSRVMGKLRDNTTKFLVDPSNPEDVAETTVNAEHLNFETAQFGCEGWTNFQDPVTGESIEIKMVPRRLGGKSYQIVDPEVMRLVPMSVIGEMGEDIRAANELSEEDVKN